MSFYKDKTFERVRLFYKNFKQTDNAEIINGEQMPKLQDLLNEVDWNWMSRGLAGRFHGDFHFEKILYSKKDKNSKCIFEIKKNKDIFFNNFNGSIANCYPSVHISHLLLFLVLVSQLTTGGSPSYELVILLAVMADL